MTHSRVRHVCAAAITLAAVAVSPGSAGAHPADCHTALTAPPTAGWPADWAPEDDGCTNAGAQPAAGGSAAISDLTLASNTTTQAPVNAPRHKPAGRLREVGHEPLMNRGMNAAIAINERLRVHRQPDRRRPSGPAAGRHHGGRHLTPVPPEAAGTPVRRQAGRVVARAARLEIAGRPDRPEHQLRRRTDAASLHAAVDQQPPLLRHLRTERDQAEAPERVQGRHARVLPVGGPEEPASGR